jgi:hypothetical protein
MPLKALPLKRFHPEIKYQKHESSLIFRIGIILQVFIKKAVEKYVFDRFFDATMLDMNSLRRNHCVSTD